MGEFFKGWRRKMGCVLLVMALAMFGASMRSRTIADWCYIPTGAATDIQIISEDSQLKLIWWQTADPWLYVGSREFGNVVKCEGVEWECMGIQCGCDTSSLDLPNIFAFFPYLSLIIPATLMSAYLILWKPRKRPA